MPIFNAARPAGLDPVFRLPPNHEFTWHRDGENIRFRFLDADRSHVHLLNLETGVEDRVTQESFEAALDDGHVDVSLTGEGTEYVGLKDRLPEDQLAFCNHMFKLAMAVEGRIAAGTASLSDVSLKRVLREETIKLALGSDEDAEMPEPKGKRGSKRATAKPVEIRTRYDKRAVALPLPSPRTFRRMRDRLIQSGWSLESLRDKRAGRSGSHMPRITDPQTVSLMADWVNLYKDRSRPTMATLYKLAIGNGKAAEVNEARRQRGELPIPVGDLKSLAEVNREREAEGKPPLPGFSKSTFERAIGALDEFEVLAGRKGRAEAHRRLKISGRREIAVMAGERVAIDTWQTQIMALKLPHECWAGLDDDLIKAIAKIRLHACLAVDEASRSVLGVRLFVSATSETAIRTLEMVGMDKTDIAAWAGCLSLWLQRCTPETVPTDSGSEFINADFRFAVRDIGARNEIGPAEHPDARPIVESCFRNLDLGLLQFFQGRTFGSIGEKGNYNPDEVANVLAETLGKALIRYIVDIYHNTPHAGLGGETPNAAWARLNKSYGILPPWSRARNRVVFGFSDNRRIQNKGIRFLGNWYAESKDHRLAKLRKKIGQKEVAIRVDLQNLGSIAVRELGADTEWFPVKCNVAAMEGVSAAEWLAVGAELQRKYAADAALREDVVILALQDIRRLGLASSEAQGIGPSTMSSTDLRGHEKKLFQHLEIRTASRRGATFEDLEAGSGEDNPVDVTHVREITSDGAAATDHTTDPVAASLADADDTAIEPTPRRRRQNLDFFQE